MSRRILEGLGSLLLIMAVGLAPCSASPTANSTQLSTFSQEPLAPSFIHSGIHSGTSLDPMVLVTSEPLKRAIVTIKTDAGTAVSPQRLQQVISILKQHGATEINPIEGLPQIVVTASDRAFEVLSQSGLVQSIHIDRVSPPN
jgi:hypothetical protein